MIKPTLSSVPAFPVAVAIVAGIVCARYGLGTYALCAGLLVCVIAALFKRLEVSVMGCSLALGTLLLMIATPREPEAWVMDAGNYYGTVEYVSEGETSRRLIVRVDSAGVDEHFRSIAPLNACLIFTSFQPYIGEGDIVRFRSDMTSAVATQDLPDETTQEDFWFAHRIVATGLVIPKDIKVVGQSDHLKWRFRRLNETLAAHIYAIGLSDSASSLLAATLLGDRGAIPSTQRESFTVAGVAHVLAVSGMHAALIALIISIGLWPLTVVWGRRTTLIVTIVLLWCYAALTGMSISVVRAVTMVTLVSGAWMLQRSHSTFNALCVSVIVCVLIEPQSVFNLGAQMSFAAVAGILVWVEVFSRLDVRRRWARMALNCVGVPLSAMLATGCISAYYFHTIPLCFLLSNVIVGFLFPIFMASGAVCLLLDLLGCHIGLLISFTDMLCDVLYATVDTIASWDFACVTGVYISRLALWGWIGGLWCLAAWIFGRRRSMLVASGMLVVFSVTLALMPQRVNVAEYYITRNKQHTDMIINSGDGRAYLVALAPTESDRQLSLANCRRRYADYFGLRRIDSVVLMPKGEVVEIGSDRWLIVNDNVVCDSTMGHFTDMLVCRGFIGDVVALYHEVSPDSVWLAADVNKRRHDRYMRELNEAGVPVKSLRDRALRRSVSF